jgi:hypothetical protein
MNVALKEIKNVITKLDPISLTEMDSVQLMNRNDYKYTFHVKQLPLILAQLSEHYKVLEIDGVRGANYKSIYFDTENLKMFFDHHNGKPVRFKIRRREYVDSGLNFMEIKEKNSQGKTKKERVKQLKDDHHFTENTTGFIHKHCPFTPHELNPQLINTFTRYTLVHKTEQERLTIDLNLCFSFERKEIALPFLVIAEVKREGDPQKSTFMGMMREMKIRQSGMSKYCIGTILLNPDIKHNRFKPSILNLKKIENDTK